MFRIKRMQAYKRYSRGNPPWSNYRNIASFFSRRQTLPLLEHNQLGSSELPKWQDNYKINKNNKKQFVTYQIVFIQTYKKVIFYCLLFHVFVSIDKKSFKQLLLLRVAPPDSPTVLSLAPCFSCHVAFPCT